MTHRIVLVALALTAIVPGLASAQPGEAPAAAPAQAAGNTQPSVASAVPEASAPEVSGGQAASSGPAASEPGATAPPQ